MHIISCFGMLWKMSDRKYQKMLRQAAAGNDINASDYGTMIGSIAMDITDITPDSASSALDSLKRRKKRKK